MATFKFQFGETQYEPGATHTAGASQEDNLKWFPSREHFIRDDHLRHTGNGVDVELFPVTDNGVVIRFLNSEQVSSRLENCDDEDSVLKKAVSANTDLMPSIYEGGLKTWECSQDLTRHLERQSINWDGKHVLELGCGSGLPGIFCFSRGAQVHFQDYNVEVIDNVTIPNVLLNVPESQTPTETRFFSGDWSSFRSLAEAKGLGQYYDIIVTSETIYNVSNQQKLLSVFDTCLTSTGQIFLAAKSHYFGVGGGIAQFTDVLDKTQKWKWRVVEKVDKEVKRAVILITRL